MKTLRKSPPQRRAWVKRLTPELRGLQPDRNKAIMMDADTCKSLRAFAAKQGWKVAQQTQPNGSMLFWRLA